MTLFFCAATSAQNLTYGQPTNESKSDSTHEFKADATHQPKRDLFKTSPQRSVWTSNDQSKSGGLFPSDLLQDSASLHVAGSFLSTSNKSLSLRGSPTHLTQVYWNGIGMNDWLTPSASAEGFEGTQEFSSLVQVHRGPQSLLYSANAVGGVIEYSRDTDESFLQVQTAGQATRRSLFENHFQSKLFPKNSRIQKINLSLGVSHFESLEMSSLSTKGVLSERATQELEKDRMIQNSRSLASTVYFNSEQVPYLNSASLLLHDRSSASDDDQPPIDDLDSVTNRAKQILLFKTIWQTPFAESIEISYSTQLNKIQSFNHANSQSTLQSRSENEGALEKTKLSLRNQFGSLRNFLGFENISEKGQFFSRFGTQTNFFDKERQIPEAFIVQEWDSENWDISYGLRQNVAQDLPLPLAGQIFVQRHFESGNSPFFSLSRGHHQPTLYQLFSEYGDSQLRIEKHQSFEVGTQWSTRRDILGKNSETKALLSYFQNDFEDLIDYDLQKFRYQNLKKVRSQGLEVELSFARARNHWKLSHLRGSSLDLETQLQRLRQPRDSTRIVWERTFTDRWSQKLMALHWGARDDLAQNERISLPSVVRFHYSQAYEWERFSVSGKIENIFGESSEEVYGYTSPGRIFILTARYFL